MSFQPDFQGVAALAVSPQVIAVVEAMANDAMQDAITEAADFAKTGEYMGSFSTRVEIQSIAGHNRAVGILENSSPHAAAVEFGNARDPQAHHTIARAISKFATPRR